MEARQITLNLVPGGVMPRIHCSQYDKGVPVEVTLYDGDTTYTVPEDATVYVQGAKLDGTLYQYECTASGSVVTFDLTIQMTVIAGENIAELAIYDGDDIVGTCNFVIDVEDSALQDPSQTSYNDIPVIADLPGLVKTAEEAAQTAVDAVEEIDVDMDEIREAVSKSSTSAQLASGYAVDSENYYLLSKSYAVGDASRVGSSVDNAMFYMNEAKEAAEDTAEDVQTIEELMEDLEEIETRTKGYSDSAALSKTSVDTLYSQTVVAKTSADYFATLAESWAHGQTGIRQDESVDNAMYWANKAQAVAKTTVDSAFSTSSVNPVENQVITNGHVNVTINRQDGVHGLRFYNDELDYYDGEKWVEIKTGGGALIVQPPVAAVQSYTYDGTEQTFAFSYFDSEHCSVRDNKKTAAGTTTVTVSLKETSYVWSDTLTTEDRTFSWTIDKATVAIPVAASQSYTYDGTQQEFAFTTTIDTTKISVTENKKTNAGSYTVNCALVDSNNYEWEDSTITAKIYSWTIAKFQCTISVSPSSVTLDSDHLTTTLTTTTTGVGTVSYSGYDSTLITMSDNVITATQETGTTTITVAITPSDLDNYIAASTTVSVNATFRPEGATVTPTDDIQTWLTCGGITGKSYTTVAEVLADSTTLLALMSDSNAVDYLVRSTTWVSDITADSTAMTDIGANDYCADTLLANSTWLNAICNSTYFENVLNVKVPTMTSDTAPSGEAFLDSEYSSSYKAYMVFNSNYPNSGMKTPWVIGYKFENATKVNRFRFYASNQSGATQFLIGFTMYVEASNDNSTWTQLAEKTLTQQEHVDAQTNPVYLNFGNSTKYLYYRFRTASNNYNYNGITTCSKLQFYGRA